MTIVRTFLLPLKWPIYELSIICAAEADPFNFALIFIIRTAFFCLSAHIHQLIHAPLRPFNDSIERCAPFVGAF